ncbi:unnamed protein product [Protopolystoma xenopodis]|uniref:Uncharacterized protein n=1 Tax=Protopolystoma xenopodis TaxID=117903 RepID=A0A3S5FDT8_9PLAT|nr:unnamed protein product [Protopolystoma xenopodis]
MEENRLSKSPLPAYRSASKFASRLPKLIHAPEQTVNGLRAYRLPPVNACTYDKIEFDMWDQLLRHQLQRHTLVSLRISACVSVCVCDSIFNRLRKCATIPRVGCWRQVLPNTEDNNGNERAPADSAPEVPCLCVHVCAFACVREGGGSGSFFGQAVGQGEWLNEEEKRTCRGKRANYLLAFTFLPTGPNSHQDRYPGDYN